MIVSPWSSYQRTVRCGVPSRLMSAKTQKRGSSRKARTSGASWTMPSSHDFRCPGADVPRRLKGGGPEGYSPDASPGEIIGRREGCDKGGIARLPRPDARDLAHRPYGMRRGVGE